MKGEVSSTDSQEVQQKFSKDAYEDAMIRNGKQAELDEHKRREAEYLKGAPQDEGQR